MPPNSMPPPKSIYAHRRTKLDTVIQLPPSPPSSPESATCLPLKMTLSKGATFHVPLSPPAEDDPVLSVRHLPQRSPTSSHTLLDLILDKDADAATKSIASFEQSFSRDARRQSASAAHAIEEYFSRSNSVDEDFKQSQQRRSSAQFSDSGLGTSIASDSVQDFKDVQGVNANTTGSFVSLAEGHGLSQKLYLNDPVIDSYPSVTIDPHSTSAQTPQPSSISGLFAHHSRSAVTRSISPINSPLPPKVFSNCARRKINDQIFQPLLREDRFKFFHPLVKSLGTRSKNSIKCLRDLERSLIFEPLKLSVSKTLYRSFGEFSIQLVLDTYLHLSEPEQRRPVDRPYDNGYFLDLVQQVGRLAAQVALSRRTALSNEESNSDAMTYSPDDVVTLEGGIGQTGDIAELVRWNKEGKGISLRTNKVYEASPGLKRQADGEFIEDAERAMARRKKNADPTPLQLKCSDPQCRKIFDRKCDLAKHEKTHSRPFKCPYGTCPYNDKGLPTEKERERHINDKHTKNPKLYSCKVCEFSTKRESNCKQHMEKKHGYTYERTKGKGKKTANTPQQTPQTPTMDTPSTGPVDYSTSDGSTTGSIYPTPLDPPLNEFGMTPSTTPYNGQIDEFSPMESDGYDPLFERTNNDQIDFSEPMFAPHHTSIKNGSSFSSPLTGIFPHNDAFGFGGSEFTTPVNAPLTNSNLRVNTQGMVVGNSNYGNSFYPGGLPTPSATSLQNLQPYSSNPSISGPSPVAPGTLHTFSPSIESNDSLHQQATFTPASNSGYLHPSFSPVGEDQLLTDIAGDSQFEQMTAVTSADTSNAFDPSMEPNTVIPDFDLYGDGTAHMEFDMQGSSDESMALFNM